MNTHTEDVGTRVLAFIVVLFMVSVCTAVILKAETSYMVTLDRINYTTKYDKGNKHDYINRYILDVFGKHQVSDNNKLFYNVAYFDYKNSIGQYSYNIKESFKRRSIFAKSLYLQHKINSHNAFAIGLIPFNYGSFAEYSTTNIQQGNGLYPLIEMPLESIQWIYDMPLESNYRVLLKAGIGQYKLFGDTINGSQSQPKELKGSIVHNYIAEIRNKKYRLEFNHFNTQGKLYGEKAFVNKLYGIGLAVEDVMDTGLSLHGIGMYSIHDSDLSRVKDEMIRDSELEPIMELYRPEYFTFDRVKNSGKSYVLGAKYYFTDIVFNKDIEIGFFHQKVDDDFVSMNRGAPNSLFGGSFQRGIANTTQLDFKYNANINFIFRYTNYNKTHLETIGNLNESIPLSDVRDNVSGEGNLYYMTIYWRF
jgi:hypothetical protein